MKIDVALSPAEIELLPQRDLRRATCVVFDILRATSTMTTALAHGAAEIIPVRTIEEALDRRTALGEALLGGERQGDPIDGFDLGNSPLEYQRSGLRRIITTTTNGTVALRACEAAATILVGALLNMEILVKNILSFDPEDLLLVCAGTFRDLALEDVYAAGMLASAFPSATLSDAARVAVATFQMDPSDPLRVLRISQNGKVLLAKGRGAEVEWCARTSILSCVGAMEGGVIRPLAAGA